MSDAVTESSAPVEHTPPPQSLPDSLRTRLSAATAPLTLKDLAKGLPRPKKVKADEFEASLPGYLAEDLQAGRVFKFPSGKAGADRYWNRDEKHAIQETVRTAAAEPKKLAALKKEAVAHTKADKPFAEGIVDEMVAGKHLHEHPGKGPLYGRDEPISPNDKAKVSAAILAQAATPAKLAALIKAAQKETKADKPFVEDVANDLIATGQLHKQEPAKAGLFGLVKPVPPHPLETVSGKKEFEKLLTAAKKLLASATGLNVSDLVARLRSGLETPAATVPTESTETPTRPIVDAPLSVSHSDSSTQELDELILGALGDVPVLSIADLRLKMRPEHRGDIFNETVLQLADKLRVIVHQDADPSQFSEADKDKFIRDGDQLYTAISKGN